MQSEKAQVQEVGGHARRIKHKSELPNMNKPSRISPNEILQS